MLWLSYLKFAGDWNNISLQALKIIYEKNYFGIFNPLGNISVTARDLILENTSQIGSSFFAFSQFTPNQVTIVQEGDGKITGTLIDSLTNNPVEFATLSLYKVSDSAKPIDGAMTDDKGKFVLKNVPEGIYVIKFSSIGYTEKQIKYLELKGKTRSLHLGNILIEPDTKMLKEVVGSEGIG